MNAQYQIDRHNMTRAAHKAKTKRYNQRRQELAQFVADWKPFVNLESVEADLQAMEHDLARFEWRHGIFS